VWYHRKNGWIAFGEGWVEFSSTKRVKSSKLGGYGWYPESVTTSVPAGTRALVSGFSQLVIDGKPVTCWSPTAQSCFPDRGDMRQRHPRTAMGLSKDRRTFILAVVDGRTSASIGMYGTELAALMHELGAWTAFNLDGGGSSAMWVKGRGYVNSPSDGSARAVANHWGIYAGAAGGKSATPGSCFVAGGCFATRVVGAETSLFKDMPTSWAGYAEAKLIHQKKITSGCKQKPDLMFCPRCAVTRRQMAAFVVRAAKIDTASPPSKPTFSDVPTSASDYAIIEAAAREGITKGCNSAGTKFCPDKEVSRGSGAVFIRGAAGFSPLAPKTPSFSDVTAARSFYKAVETLKDRCVVGGCGGGKFCPADPLSRARAAVWVVKAFNLDGKNVCLVEICNGKDDDFDGQIDEGCVATDGAAGTEAGAEAGLGADRGMVDGADARGPVDAVPTSDGDAPDGDEGGCSCEVAGRGRFPAPNLDGRIDLALTGSERGHGVYGVSYVGDSPREGGVWRRWLVDRYRDVMKYDNVVAADLDGDGDADLLTTDENVGSWSYGLGVVWFENLRR
jgi:hypothetical protein